MKEIQETCSKGKSGVRASDIILTEEGIKVTLSKSVRDKRALLASIKASEEYKLHAQPNMYTNMRRLM